MLSKNLSIMHLSLFFVNGFYSTPDTFFMLAIAIPASFFMFEYPTPITFADTF
jgi:hypothetical protein